MEDLDAEVSLYRPSTDEVLVLNQSAADIWRLIGQDDDVDRIIAILAQAYAIEPAAISTDVHRTLTDLSDRGFVHWQSPAEMPSS